VNARCGRVFDAAAMRSVSVGSHQPGCLPPEESSGSCADAFTVSPTSAPVGARATGIVASFRRGRHASSRWVLFELPPQLTRLNRSIFAYKLQMNINHLLRFDLSLLAWLKRLSLTEQSIRSSIDSLPQNLQFFFLFFPSIGRHTSKSIRQ